MLMNPNTLSDAIKQGGMYILAAGGAVATEAGGQSLFAYIIGGSTLILIWSNIVLNRARLKDLKKTADTPQPPVAL